MGTRYLLDTNAYGQLKHGHEALARIFRKASALPFSLVVIAAHAFESGAELLSFDAHFAAVPGLVWTHLR